LVLLFLEEQKCFVSVTCGTALVVSLQAIFYGHLKGLIVVADEYQGLLFHSFYYEGSLERTTSLPLKRWATAMRPPEIKGEFELARLGVGLREFV
jgi:hypothetical protein